MEQLRAKYKGYQIYTMEEFTSMLSISNVGMLKSFIAVVIGVAVVVGFIVVFMAMYTAVLERTREIGILKAVGGSSALILNILFRETLVLALLGSVVGIALTYVSQWLMEHVDSGESGAGDGLWLVADCDRDRHCRRTFGSDRSWRQSGETGCYGGSLV